MFWSLSFRPGLGRTVCQSDEVWDVEDLEEEDLAPDPRSSESFMEELGVSDESDVEDDVEEDDDPEVVVVVDVSGASTAGGGGGGATNKVAGRGADI
jgi:hypothetical protein